MTGRSRTFARTAVLLAVAAGLSACSANMDELDAYINETKSKPGRGIEPLPEITPYEVFSYEADNLRSPFQPDSAQVVTNTAGAVTIDEERIREYLEGFPLDSLAMVGTLDISGTYYGLVQTSDGLIHRVIPGNYMGQNYGRVTDITESEIALVEVISDGIGGYIERDAAVSLTD
ncbi:MAG: pilus assembly protein PilP [Pseudomonadota bacterium]